MNTPQKEAFRVAYRAIRVVSTPNPDSPEHNPLVSMACEQFPDMMNAAVGARFMGHRIGLRVAAGRSLGDDRPGGLAGALERGMTIEGRISYLRNIRNIRRCGRA